MKNLLQIIFFLFTATAFAQNCTCEENFNWAKKTFEENDAGYNYILTKKGEAAYKDHNQVFLKRVKSITKNDECSQAIYEWMKFFRGGHISASAINNQQQNNNTTVTEKHDDWEKYTISEKEFTKYIAKTGASSIEGIWKTDPYTIGIIKKGDGYIGFIINAEGTSWEKGQIKMRFKANNDNDGFSGEYYLRNYQPYKFDKAQLIGKKTFLLGGFLLQKVTPKVDDDKVLKDYLELLLATQPMVKQFSKNTVVLRIPSFNEKYKKQIDSLLTVNHDKITSTQNLIIDVRNNGGGSDGSYQEIIKYLYTNPIRVVMTQMYSTPLNNQRMEGFLKEPDLSEEEKKDITDGLKKLNDNLGKFISLNDKKVYLETLDEVYNYPQNVAILINENNASTTEQFLLAAKQSSKTKLFGHTTAGMLDMSNMHFVTSPCGTIQIGYCLSKSLRIPHMAIDDIGIQPDYYLDNEIPDHEWIEYAEKVFSGKK